MSETLSEHPGQYHVTEQKIQKKDLIQNGKIEDELRVNMDK